MAVDNYVQNEREKFARIRSLEQDTHKGMKPLPIVLRGGVIDVNNADLLHKYNDKLSIARAESNNDDKNNKLINDLNVAKSFKNKQLKYTNIKF